MSINLSHLYKLKTDDKLMHDISITFKSLGQKNEQMFVEFHSRTIPNGHFNCE